MKHLPEHIGIIPDGNRRWAVMNGMQKPVSVLVAPYVVYRDLYWIYAQTMLDWITMQR